MIIVTVTAIPFILTQNDNLCLSHDLRHSPFFFARKQKFVKVSDEITSILLIIFGRMPTIPGDLAHANKFAALPGYLIKGGTQNQPW